MHRRRLFTKTMGMVNKQLFITASRGSSSGVIYPYKPHDYGVNKTTVIMICSHNRVVVS